MARISKNKSYITRIVEWEMGELDEQETLELFSMLIKNNMIYHMQGVYHRMADNLVKLGYLSGTGDILKECE